MVANKNVTWTEEEYRMHVSAARLLDEIKDDAFTMIARAVSAKQIISELDVQDHILKRYKEGGLVASIKPVVAVDEGTREPHHVSRADALIEQDNLVLVDVFAKVDAPSGIYADLTWMAYTGEQVPRKFTEIFGVVTGARDVVLEYLKSSFEKGDIFKGYMLDDVARDYITERGYGGYYIHRTGHSLGKELVGEGIHPDNYKTKDIREVTPGCGFTVEPGIYLNDFGVRSEINVYITEEGPEVTTRIQKVITKLIE